MKTKQEVSQQDKLKDSKSSTPLQTKEPWFISDTLNITFDSYDFSISVTEQAPIPSRIVFSGGGSRILAHIGALDELTRHGLKFTEFSGSSAGAMVAAFAYLGYNCSEIKQIISWFNEDKLLDSPLIFNFNNIKQIFNKGGLSSAKLMRQAANYVILKKVMDIISDEKFKARFTTCQDFLEENIYSCPENITFQTLARIKKICPECELGEKLFITGTNLSTQKHEVFSIDSTPSMALADAIIISANLPIAFERICYKGNVYSDGGISNNLPAHCFSEKEHKTTFLKHKDDVDFSVLALQFDNGLEENALYSQNPIPKWSWLSNTFYSLITGHPNVTENWHEDLQILRRHAHQSILIKTPSIALTNLTLSQDTKEALIESGRTAARTYLDYHEFYTDTYGNIRRNECLYEKFQKPEELLDYCIQQGHVELLKKIKQAISDSQYLEKGYKHYLCKLCENFLPPQLKCSKEDPGIEQPENKLEKETIIRKRDNNKGLGCSITFFGTHSSLVKTLNQDSPELKIKLFTGLYPILIQNWQNLCPVSGISGVLNSIRMSLLEISSTDACIKTLINKLNEIEIGHFLIFVFKAALKNYDKNDFILLLKNLKHLHHSIELIRNKPFHSDDRFYGQWNFEGHDPKRILEFLKSDDISGLMTILEDKKALPNNKPN
ncbi:TPA: patatin-like phospholipase family protein [Legionella pneumophila]|nr:patatin-like phospholipase family protein [Legionella pneumophila]HAT1860078.1 patatin-like phospholipase family protein [Legionella pneumophila]HBC0463227.1 patatin-like phospholipase family protein [Legionella pneumophila]